MALVKYEGRSTGGRWVVVPGGEIFVAHGRTAEIPDELVDGLVAQGFEVVEPKAPSKKKAAASADTEGDD